MSSLKRFFKTHPEIILIGFAIFLLSVIGISFFWGTRFLMASVNDALKVSVTTEKPAGFNIEGAQSLNLNPGE